MRLQHNNYYQHADMRINGYRVVYATQCPVYKQIINDLIKANSIEMHATPFPQDDLIDLSEMTYNPCFVVLSDGEVIGFFSLNMHIQASYGIVTYLVQEHYRNKGIGSGMLAFCEKMALSSKIDYLSAETYSNAPSDRCLEKNEFELIGTYPERYTFFDGDKNVKLDKKMWVKKMTNV